MRHGLMSPALDRPDALRTTASGDRVAPAQLRRHFCAAYRVASAPRAAQTPTHGCRACAEAFIRHRAYSTLTDRLEQDWDARDVGHIRYGATWCEARRPPRFPGAIARGKPLSIQRPAHDRCRPIEGASRETHSRISPSWRNSPSGRSPVSQDAASAYEIAPGVAFGSPLPDVVTRVT